MQRSLLLAIVLLLAAIAAALLLLQDSAASATELPATQKEESSAAAEAVANTSGAQATPSTSQPERAVAEAIEPATPPGTTAVLRVFAFYKTQPEETSSPDTEPPARDVLITLRWGTRERANAVREQVLTDASGLATFVGVPPGKWRLQSDRGDSQSIEVVPGEANIAFGLDVGISVAGTVVDSRRNPVANASIWLQTRSPKWYGGRVLTKSDEQGRFALEHIPPHVSLGAFARNHTRSALVDLDVVDTKRRPAEVTLQLLDRGGQLAGIVVDQAGRPIANAIVGVGKQDGRLDMRGKRIIERWSIRSTKTGSNGRFLLEGLLPGKTTMAVRKRGYGIWRSECEVLDQQDQEIRITLQRSGTLHGIVTNNAGEPFAGALIRSYDLEPGIPFIAGGQIDFEETFGYVATTADEHGAYTLPDVTAGTAHVFVQKGGRYLRMGEPVPYATAKLEMPPGGKVEWNPQVTNGRTVEGIVYYKDGHPMPNVFITLIDQKSGKQHVQTNNKDGVFTFVNLDDTTYDVHVQVWNAPKGAPPLERSGVVPDQGRVELHATFDKPVKLAKGTVTGRIDDAGLRIQNLQNAYVSLHHEERWFLEGDKLTDGSFQFDNVAPGKFRLVLKEGDTVLCVSDGHELQPGGQLDVGMLQTRPGGSVRIRVTRDAGTEACDPKVYFRKQGDVASSSVALGIGNEKLVTSLSPGTYQVSAYHKGMASVTASVTVAAGQTSNLSLHLKAGTLTRFETWMPPEQNASNYQYSIQDSVGQTVRSSKGSYGSQSRRPFAFALTLPTGDYTITFAADTTFAGTAKFSVDGSRPEQTVRVDLAAK